MTAHDDHLLLQAVQHAIRGNVLAPLLDDVYVLASIKCKVARRRYTDALAYRCCCNRRQLVDVVEAARNRYLSLRATIKLGSGPSLAKARGE